VPELPVVASLTTATYPARPASARRGTTLIGRDPECDVAKGCSSPYPGVRAVLLAVEQYAFQTAAFVLDDERILEPSCLSLPMQGVTVGEAPISSVLPAIPNVSWRSRQV
jgi:hypothetical protein